MDLSKGNEIYTQKGHLCAMKVSIGEEVDLELCHIYTIQYYLTIIYGNIVETGGDGVKGSQPQENKSMVFSFREGENTQKGLKNGVISNENGEKEGQG